MIFHVFKLTFSMNFNSNDFKIIYGSTQEEIEDQVKLFKEQGYVLHGTVIAQPNSNFGKDPLNAQQPFLYYQMLAKQNKAACQQKIDEKKDSQ